MSIINLLQNSSADLTGRPFIEALSSENQTIVVQTLILASQEVNKISKEMSDEAISNGISPTSILVSSLGSRHLQNISSEFNQSAFIQYKKQLNLFANLQEFLLSFTTNLTINDTNSIKLQALSLAELTQSTSQLTRSSIMIASDKCHELALALFSNATNISYQDIQTASISIVQCANNVLQAINAPLQQRSIVLDLDLIRSNTISSDDYEGIDFDLFADEVAETIKRDQNMYHQKQTANKLTSQVDETISLVTSSLKTHLNLSQMVIMNTSEMIMSIEKLSIESLSNKSIKLVENAQINIPSKLNHNSTILVRSIIHRLASYGNSQFEANTNLSRSISLSILDQNENELSHPIEIIIPRDSNLVLPEMILQNMTLINILSKNDLFYFQFLDLKQIQPNNNLTISLHFQLRPLNKNLSYLLIYIFDQTYGSIEQIDGWFLFCPFNLTSENLYTNYIDNKRTSNHQTIVYGIRELNSTEMRYYCSNMTMDKLPIANQRTNFTSNYDLRIYTSGCYYLDQYNNWQSDGLLVGPLTTPYQTQCFTIHL